MRTEGKEESKEEQWEQQEISEGEKEEEEISGKETVKKEISEAEQWVKGYDLPVEAGKKNEVEKECFEVVVQDF